MPCCYCFLTVSSSLCQSSEFLLIRRRSEVSATSDLSTQGSERPRKKAAPLPPAVLTKTPLRSVGSEPSLVTADEVRSHPRASSTPIAFQPHVAPKAKRKAPPPPLKNENVALEISSVSRSCVSTLSSSSAGSFALSSSSDVDTSPAGSVIDDVSVGRNTQNPSNPSLLEKQSCQLNGEPARVGNGTLDEVFVSSMTGHTVATGSLVSPNVATIDFRSGTITADPFFDLPPPPPFEECSISYGDVHDLPPPPLNAEEEFPLAIYDDDPLPLPEPHSSVQSTSNLRQLESADIAQVAVKSPSSRHLVSRGLFSYAVILIRGLNAILCLFSITESVHSSFEVEMDELSSILDSVVAEAEAYLTSPKESPENLPVIQKFRSSNLSKVPPHVARKPEMPSSLPVVKSRNFLQREANKAEDTKTRFTHMWKQKSPASRKGPLPPPKPTPYAESPAAKRRSGSSQASSYLSVEEVSTSNSLKCSHTTPPQLRETSSISAGEQPSVISKSPVDSHKHRSSIAKSPRRSAQSDREISSPVSRARSSTLPARVAVDEGRKRTPCSPLASRHLLLSDGTGTVRGVKGQVKKRVGSFPDVSVGLSDVKKSWPQHVETTGINDSDSGLPEVIGRGSVLVQSRVNADGLAVVSNVKEEPLGTHAQTHSRVFRLPSVSGEGANTIVFNLPPPPCEPPPTVSSTPETDKLHDLKYVPTAQESLPLPSSDSTEVVLYGSKGPEAQKPVSVHVNPVFTDFSESYLHGYDDPSNIPDDLPPQPDIAYVSDYELPDSLPDFLPPPPLAAPNSEESDAVLDETFVVSTVEEEEARQLKSAVGDTAPSASDGSSFPEFPESQSPPAGQANIVVGFDLVTSGEGVIVNKSKLPMLSRATKDEVSLRHVFEDEVNDREKELQLPFPPFCQEPHVELIIDGESVSVGRKLSPSLALPQPQPVPHAEQVTTGNADFHVDDSDAGVATDRSQLSQSLSLPPPPAELLAVENVELDRHGADLSAATGPSQVSLSPPLPAVLAGCETPDEVLFHCCEKEVEPHINVAAVLVPVSTSGEERHGVQLSDRVLAAAMFSRPENGPEGPGIMISSKPQAQTVVLSGSCEIPCKQYLADATIPAPFVDESRMIESLPCYKEAVPFQDLPLTLPEELLISQGEPPPLPQTHPPLPKTDEANCVEGLDSVSEVFDMASASELFDIATASRNVATASCK